jgi:secreted trypsin-like serine protease
MSSYGQGCARNGYPGIYTRISYYNNWIISNISNNGKKTIYYNLLSAYSCLVFIIFLMKY